MQVQAQVVENRVGKKIVFIFLFTVIIFLFLGFQNIKAANAKVGLINFLEILSSHPYTEKINQLSLTLVEELKKRQEELNKQGKGLDETELKKIEEKFNKEWEPTKQKIITEMNSYQASRYSDIIEAVKVIGDKGKYDLILNSEIKVPTGNDTLIYPIVFYGGEDITQDVIAEINRKLAEENKAKDTTTK